MNLFEPKATIGILGGGQLGKMLIQASIDWDLKVHILDPDPEAPCRHLAHTFYQASLQDQQAIVEMGSHCDVVTIEIEHVSISALKILQNKGVKVFPNPDIIKLVQDKRLQKQFYQEKGYPTSLYWLIEDREEVRQYVSQLPLVHKTALAGYDGKGVNILYTQKDIENTFDEPSLLEKKVDIQKEISVIVARNISGEIRAFDPVEMVFHPEGNLVEYLISPSTLSPNQLKEAQALAKALVEDLGHIGLLAVEMFLDADDQLLINEIAPRPHNSGHHTIQACMTSQYQQHLRAIFGLPLGAPDQIIPAAMVNILGDSQHSGFPTYTSIAETLAIPGAYPFIYGKMESRPFRKMGHVTILDADLERLKVKIEQIKKRLKVVVRTDS